ncbi:nucleotidyltransferase family protein [Pelovirga terrestris]|uniref:Nucleotidyltransferase domain-containing protein n=1 Tax=Pelovirga terrestris TaxID=2771352 RepID=A0A8J6QQJ1_9BACT|nr:nucleotidyltransferase domain-containing protein [Pelovirga terrestris]MBD1401261.1 nucleotidyltransferase domain-containing protein [Pelovirga terrestris]
MRTEEITEFLATHKDEMAQRFGVVKIGLFGSYARGEADDHSDIDIAIEMAADQKNLHNFLALKRHLEETFGKKIDIGAPARDRRTPDSPASNG